MTKLKPDIKPNRNIHTLKDKHRAQKQLSRLVNILDSTTSRTKTDLDVIAHLKKQPFREVDV